MTSVHHVDIIGQILSAHVGHIIHDVGIQSRRRPLKFGSFRKCQALLYHIVLIYPHGKAAVFVIEIGYGISRRYDRHENDYQQPANFYGVGGMKIFRDLIYTMQGMMKEDHRFYKEHGFYDFPQKRMGMVLGMYLVGAMMNSEKLSKKIGGNMTKGMLMPYQTVINKANLEIGKKSKKISIKRKT